MRCCGWVAYFLGILLTSGCISGTGPAPVRLYAPPAQPLGPAQVSTLSGYVQFVDGRDVSALGTHFELLPGCHVIGTPAQWGYHPPGGDTVVTATTGNWPFVLPMRAGRQYLIEVQVVAMTGPTAPLNIVAHERDLAGNEIHQFGYSKSPKDLETCRNELREPSH